jgi:hypothetical protein
VCVCVCRILEYFALEFLKCRRLSWKDSQVPVLGSVLVVKKENESMYYYYLAAFFFFFPFFFFFHGMAAV